MTPAPAEARGATAPGSRPWSERDRTEDTATDSRPIDPELLQRVPAARNYVALTVVLGLAKAVAICTTALSLAHLLAGFLAGEPGPAQRPLLLTVLVASLLARALCDTAQERFAHRAATKTVADLRAQVLDAASARGPRWLEDRGSDLTALVTTGLEDLRPYLTGFVPQLGQTATVVPLVLVVMATQDLMSAGIAAVTLPIIPVFMILVGRLTAGRSEKLLGDMRRLSAQLMDLVAGLPTLKQLGREHGPAHRVRALAESHHRSTMGVLRYAFLSSAALEFFATLSVALIAVSIGLRLVNGEMLLLPGIACLVLAPEVYNPVRQVGAQFHNSTDGLAAARAALAVLDEEDPPPGLRPVPDLAGATVVFDDVSVRSRSGWAPHAFSGAARPGEVTVLAGASGTGKSTLTHLLLTLVRPDAGRLVLRTADGAETGIAELDREAWWGHIAWTPQRPVLLPGTVRENLLRGAGDSVPGDSGPGDEQVLAAARATGFDAVLADLDDGLDARIGQGGLGLSVGQRQRLALTRTLLQDAPVVVLDEPTAHLDTGTEAAVLASLAALAAEGRTVIVVAHRERVISTADTVLPVAAAATPSESSEEVTP